MKYVLATPYKLIMHETSADLLATMKVLYILFAVIPSIPFPMRHLQENERLAAYKKKVSKAVAAHELAISKPTVSLNISAANRCVCHALCAHILFMNFVCM
jgi:hypothetical protein